MCRTQCHPQPLMLLSSVVVVFPSLAQLTQGARSEEANVVKQRRILQKGCEAGYDFVTGCFHVAHPLKTAAPDRGSP